MTEQIWLLVANPRRVADGAVQTVRLAGGGTQGYKQFGATDWMAGLDRPPAIAQKLGFPGKGFGEGAVIQASELRWRGPAARQATLGAYYWGDATFTLYRGPDGGADGAFSILLSGRVADARPVGRGELVLQLVDPTADLAKPVVTGTFAGTGGIEGPAELKGQSKWRAWGKCRNVTLRSLKPATNIWVATDPSLPIQAFDQVYDRGNAASGLTVVAWAGSIAATLAALEATAAPAGGAAVAPSISCIKWWYANPGKLTCDLRGEIGTGYVDRPADIAAALSAAVGGPTFNAAQLTAARAARNGEAGWLIEDPNATAAEQMEQLLSGVSLWWALSAAGEIEIGEWVWGGPVATIKAASIERSTTFQPVSKVTVRYRTNNTVMARGDIAQALVPLIDTVGTARFPEAPPLNPVEGSEYIDSTGRRYRFEGTVITSNGVPITSNGSEITCSGWVDVQDQAIPAAQATADAAQQAAALAQTTADLANAKIADIAADNIIDAGEKRAVKLEYDTLLGEQAGLDAQATSFAITTEKTAYDTAISALTTYLATLTTPTLWSDTSGKTDIVSATFRAKFQDAYTARTALMTKIAQVAATQSTWTGTTGKPSNVGALTGGEAIQNTQITLASGNIQGIGTGNGTTVANSALQANADGTVSYFNGTSWINLGAVTIVGMGGGALAFLNAVNPATGQVLSTGSVPPSIPDNSFSYTSNTNSVTITWPAMTIYRADGTTIAISSGSQAITGLASATTYRVYPYVADSGGTTGTISFVTGGSGSPSAAFGSTGSAAAAAAMYGRGNIPMGNFNVATTSSGSGGGGGGGTGWCLHPKTGVMTDQGFRAADTLQAGMMLRTPDGWSPIVSVQRKPASRWIGVATNMSGFAGVIVTASHVFYRANGSHVAASDVRLGDLLKAEGRHAEVTGLTLHEDLQEMVIIELAEPHLYFAGINLLLSHNAIQKP